MTKFSLLKVSSDYDDRDGHRNVGILRTPNAADSPRRLYQVHSPRKHQDLYRLRTTFIGKVYKLGLRLCFKTKC